MKTLNFLWATPFLLAVTLLISCEKNQAPTCQFIKPTDGSTVAKGDIVPVSISAEDADGLVSEVRLFIDDEGLSSLEFPYKYNLNTGELGPGSYTLRVTARDDEGLESEDEVEIIIDAVYSMVTTLQAISTRYKSMVLSAEVSENGGDAITETGFYFGTSPDPASSGTRLPVATETGSITATLTDLIPGSTYYYTAFAVNGAGESTGEEMNYILPEVEQGAFTDPRDQEDYGTVKIGEQVWMSENLKATVLNDGTEILQINDSAAWSINTGPAYCLYDNDPQWVDYGVLYTWYTINTGKLCPAGWHVPSDTEWRELEYYLGMDDEVALTDGFRGTNEGGMLKTTDLWIAPNTGATDELGFAAMPSGRRGYRGEFAHLNKASFFWSSEIGVGDEPLVRVLVNDKGQISRTTSYKNNAYSVRCIQDE